MKKTYKTILMSGVVAFSVAAFASCGEKNDNAATSTPDTAPAAPAVTETVSLQLSGLK